MADIKKELNDIKNAVYGREVRGSIHDGIKKINEESEESKAKAEEAHDVMESIINEGFDNAALEANFEQKLDDKIANLQPEWTGFKEDVTTQLADTEAQINNLVDKKADKDTISNSLNTLKNQKIDQVTFAISTQEIEFYANGNLIDTIDVTEASNAQLVQDYIDSLVADNVIEGVTLADNSVVTNNLADNIITRNKISNDYLINTPHLEGEENDLDYVWDVGTRVVFESVLNNPIEEGFALLNVERVRTSFSNNLLWIKQTITNITTNINPLSFYRVLRIDLANTEVTYKSEWKEILTDKVTNDNLDRHYNMRFPWLNNPNDDLNYIWETGTYIISENVKNNPTNGIAILEVVESKTEPTGIYSWIKQILTVARRRTEPSIYYRVFRVNVTTNEIDFMHDWKLLNDNNYDRTTWVALGTSITSRGEYTNYVADKLGLELDNRGVGSGGITSHAGAGNTTMQAVENIEDFKGIVSIELGANDWGNCPLGEIGDTDENTWYGAVDKVCRTITKRTSARPFFITSPRRVFQLNANFDESKRRSVYEVNSQGFSYVDYCNAVKEVAQHYGIPVVDIAGESGLGGYHNNSATLIDHIHLSQLGGKIMGNHIIKFLENDFSPFPSDYDNPLA